MSFRGKFQVLLALCCQTEILVFIQIPLNRCLSPTSTARRGNQNFGWRRGVAARVRPVQRPLQPGGRSCERLKLRGVDIGQALCRREVSLEEGAKIGAGVTEFAVNVAVLTPRRHARVPILGRSALRIGCKESNPVLLKSRRRHHQATVAASAEAGLRRSRRERRRRHKRSCLPAGSQSGRQPPTRARTTRSPLHQQS
jgi:hypothetical protein